MNCSAASKQWLFLHCHSQPSFFYVAVLRSWYEGSSFHSVGSLTKKICAFIFPFNERTPKTAAVLCHTQVARPVADNDCQDVSRIQQMPEFGDSFRGFSRCRNLEICHHMCSHICPNSVIKERQPNENIWEVPKVSTTCIFGSLRSCFVWIIHKQLQKHVIQWCLFTNWSFMSRALHMSICRLPKDWRHRPRRPRHTWLRTLEADL